MAPRKKRASNVAEAVLGKGRKLSEHKPLAEEIKSSSDIICRVCMSCDDPETPMIQLFKRIVQGMKLSEVLALVGSVEIKEQDGLPKVCCMRCLESVEQAYKLQVLCQDSDRKLRARYANVEHMAVKKDEGEMNPLDEKDAVCESAEEDQNLYDVEDNESINSGKDAQEEDDEKKAEAGPRKTTLSDVFDVVPAIGFSCCGCKHPFDTLEDLHEHGRVVHSVDKQSAAQLLRKKQCDICYKVFIENRSLIRHKNASKTNLRCKTCGDIFSNRAQVYTHYRRTHGPNATVSGSSRLCCGCKEKFDSIEKLKEHSETVHIPEKLPPDPERPFVCDICYRNYTTDARLFAHRIRLIKRIKKHQCMQCGKTFCSPSQLQDHELYHIGKKIFQCPECPEAYSNKESFRKHVQRHKTPKDKFQCKICDRCFKTNYVLKEHLVLHSGERPLQCPYCPANFARESCRTQHVKYFHQKLKPFPCFFCPKRYPRMGYRRKHMEKTHTDELRKNPVPMTELFGRAPKCPQGSSQCNVGDKS